MEKSETTIYDTCSFSVLFAGLNIYFTDYSVYIPAFLPEPAADIYDIGVVNGLHHNGYTWQNLELNNLGKKLAFTGGAMVVLKNFLYDYVADYIINFFGDINVNQIHDTVEPQSCFNVENLNPFFTYDDCVQSNLNNF